MKWKDYSCRCGPLFHISLKNICVSSDVVSIDGCVENCGDDCMGRVYRDCAEIVVVAVIDSCLLAAFYHFLAERYATSKRSANEIALPSVCLSVCDARELTCAVLRRRIFPAIYLYHLVGQVPGPVKKDRDNIINKRLLWSKIRRLGEQPTAPDLQCSATDFSDHFAAKVEKIRSNTASADVLSVSTRPSADFSFRPVTHDEALKIIMRAPSKLCLLDPLPT